jgi:hypothetical protein
MRSIGLLAAAVIGLSAASCRATAPNPFGERSVPGARTIEVIVTNQNWAAVRIYATASGRDFPMGTVETGNTQTLEVPRTAIGAFDFRLSVYAIASGEWYTTDTIAVDEGSVIEFMVENNLVLSHYMVFER